MKSIFRLLLLTVVLTAASCEQNLLEMEQYKKVIYLKSGDNHILTYPYTMNDGVSTGYLTIGSGGTMPLEKDLQVKLALDTPALNKYNYRIFGNEYGKYAQLLDARYYESLNLDAVVPKGEVSATVALPVALKVSALSPDTTYMIPVRIASVSDFEVNPEKDFILFRIGLENKYTSVVSRSYKMKGLKQVGSGAVSTITTTKVMQPLGSNRVRIFPENIAATTVLSDIEGKTIVLVINSDNSVNVLPYKSIKVEENGACLYNEATKEFLLHYRYRLTETAQWITVTETLTRVE